MVVKIFVTRKIRPDRMKDAVLLLTRIRYNAMKVNGYIMSETLNRYANPTEVVVSSMWQSIEDWEKWRTNPQRVELAKEFSKIMIEPEKIDIFEMGIIQDFIADE